jgi:hypothetical protein
VQGKFEYRGEMELNAGHFNMALGYKIFYIYTFPGNK